jgi:pimeloyl-ACP methyl ester carboxylesterase
MPYATNPIDHVRTSFEDSGGGGRPVLVYPGFADPLEYAKASPLARALRRDFRLVFADHRGQGRSDKPHEVASYALAIRVADAVAVLDALGIERAHYLGFSLGARLGFAIGEHAPERLLSLVLCGNQPYGWPDGPMLRAVSAAVAAGRERGMAALVETWESSIGERFPEPGRTWMLENDPLALDAMLRSSLTEGPISRDLTRWRIPCLIYAGAEDEMHEGAARAAAEIPGAVFVSLPGHTHLSAERVADELLPHVLALFRGHRRRPGALTLGEDDRRVLAVWAADCAERTLPLFEARAPSDTRPREAIDGLRAFSRGEMRIGQVRALSARAHAAAREVTEPAAVAAARAAGQAAGVAHMAAHARGAAANAAKAAGLAAPDDPTAVADEVRWQLRRASPAVRDVLLRLPAPTGRGGMLGGLIADLHTGLGGPASP